RSSRRKIRIGDLLLTLKESNFSRREKGERVAKNFDLKKVKCYACQKMGHFARDCTQQNDQDQVSCNTIIRHFSYVSSTVFLTESHPLWILDSGATDHVSKDRGSFVEYRRLPKQSKWLYVGNNDRIEVKGLGTCRVDLRGGKTLILHDVLHA